MTKRKPLGYWIKEENTLFEARRVMGEHGWTTLPSQKEIQKHGYNSLNTAISKYHGGIQTFRTKLGQTNTKKPQKYWQSLDNTLIEAQQAMFNEGWTVLPSADQLEKKGYSPLNNAINKYYGGLPAFRTKLGQTNPDTKPQGYWQKLENVLAETQQAMQKHKWKTLPSFDKLREHGYNSLNYAIRYHGGIQTIREKLGQTNTTKPNAYWQSLENTLAEAQQAMQKHKWKTLPSFHKLREHGYNSLNRAITTYHGGMRTFRITLGQQNTTKQNGYWKKEENVLLEARKAMQEQGWYVLPP